MYCVGRIRSPYPWVMGRPLPCIGSASPAAIKPSMANTLDKLCWSYQDPGFIPTTSPQQVDLTAKLLMKCVKDSSEKQKVEELLVSLASDLGVGAGGDVNDLVDDIRCVVLESEKKRQAAEKRASVIEQKHLHSAMKIQLLEMELAEARRQRDAAVNELQDLSWQPALISPSADSLTAHVTWVSEDIPQTPSSVPTDTRVAPPTPITPYTPEIAHYPTPTLDTASINTIAVPTGLLRSSPEVSGLVPEVDTPSSALTLAQSPVADHPSPNSRPSSVSGSGAMVSSGSAAAPLPSYMVWNMDDLKSFHQGGGDVVLGSGVSATVQLFRHRFTNKPVAVKIFRLPDAIQGMHLKMDHIMAEANLLDIFGRNDCFPSYLGCLETSPGYIGIAMDFIGDSIKGESWTLYRSLRELVLSHNQWLELALDVARSLDRIHQMGYLMNDLKEDNCLLQKTSTGQWKAVIVDFGLVYPRTQPFFCRLSDEDKEKYRRREVYVHIAPECALDDQGTTIMSDVFQLGRLLKMMGVAIYNPDLTRIGRLCIQKSPLNRPTIEEVVEVLEELL